jgi:small subunit ribosomal protein S18
MADETKETTKETKETKETKKDGIPLDDVFDDSSIVEERRPRRPRRVKVELKCPFCESGTDIITYKDVYQLKKYTSVRGKIIGRDKSGMCAPHQRQLSSAIKKARYMALLPYVSVTK